SEEHTSELQSRPHLVCRLLLEKKYGVTPDPRFLYFGTTHREALASLFYGIESGCGFLAFFFFNDTATTEIYTLSLHDALPICSTRKPVHGENPRLGGGGWRSFRG